MDFHSTHILFPGYVYILPGTQVSLSEFHENEHGNARTGVYRSGKFQKGLFNSSILAGRWEQSLLRICYGSHNHGFGVVSCSLVNQKIFGSSFFKTTYFYPNVIPMAAASMIWLYIFLPGYGFLNYILGKIGIPNIEWVGDSKFAIWALIIVAIWKNAGYYMVIFLGGLQQLPTEIYEVATIDGASAWRKFWKITWPLLSPTTFFAFIIAVINSFQAVDQIYLMTRGGPANSTNMFVYYIYQVAFKYWDFGYASALTVILLVLLLVFTVLAFFFMERRVFYESGERL